MNPQHEQAKQRHIHEEVMEDGEPAAYQLQQVKESVDAVSHRALLSFKN
jgi:hypothetical protein